MWTLILVPFCVVGPPRVPGFLCHFRQQFTWSSFGEKPDLGRLVSEVRNRPLAGHSRKQLCFVAELLHLIDAVGGGNSPSPTWWDEISLK
jgi:hypothetical protein